MRLWSGMLVLMSASVLACGAGESPAQDRSAADRPPPPSDTLELLVTVDQPDCVPGVCTCRGSTERSSGLWRIGIEDRELTEGVHCVGADFDGNGAPDLAILGGEGRAAVIMYSGGKPTSLIEVDAGGLIELYEPREAAGPRGEPASPLPGLLVQYVGRNHLVLLWSGGTFERVVFPTS
ncbi:MAG: hypothetical protein OEO79_06955 [Gemmatimonadota bacterium]|nr:hypothetical protein [Gemmatimonadota bacterium]MDH3423080.1 hypothetical protein [Gemmatimonadota bacterium]